MILKHIWKITTLICLIIIFLQRGCDSKNIDTVKIKTPVVVGKIDSPSGIINHKGKKDSIVYKKGKTIYTENPFNKKLAEELLQAQKDNDSLKVLTMYLSAIQEREQTRVFDDKYLTVTVHNKTRGELLNQKIDYKIKPQEIKIETPIKTTVFAAYLGGGIYTDLNDKTGVKIDLGLQNKKGDLFSGGYDPINKVGFVDYKLRIINVKR